MFPPTFSFLRPHPPLVSPRALRCWSRSRLTSLCVFAPYPFRVLRRHRHRRAEGCSPGKGKKKKTFKRTGKRGKERGRDEDGKTYCKFVRALLLSITQSRNVFSIWEPLLHIPICCSLISISIRSSRLRSHLVRANFPSLSPSRSHWPSPLSFFCSLVLALRALHRRRTRSHNMTVGRSQSPTTAVTVFR